MNPPKILFALTIIMAMFLAASCDKENIDDYLVPTCAKNPGNQTDPWEDGGNREPVIKKDTATAGFDIKIDPWHGGRIYTLVFK